MNYRYAVPPSGFLTDAPSVSTLIQGLDGGDQIIPFYLNNYQIYKFISLFSFLDGQNDK